MFDRYGWPDQSRAAVAGLCRHLPADAGPVGLVHGDFYSNNWLFDGPRLSAVLDWEVVHVGQAAADLGWLAMMYDPASWDPAHRADIALSPAPEALLARYEARSGRALTEPDWFRALAGVRMAALTTYFLAQHRHGNLHDPTWERIATSVPFMLARAVDLLR